VRSCYIVIANRLKSSGFHGEEVYVPTADWWSYAMVWMCMRLSQVQYQVLLCKVVSRTKRSASVAEPFRFERRKASKLVSEVPTRMAVVNDDWVPVV
jgi:hypothetical protein